MKRLCFIIVATFFAYQLGAQSIIAAEYYIDEDPGIGMANTLTVNTNTGSLNQSFSISMATEDEGIHLITFRVKDDTGRWSFNDNQWVYVSKSNKASDLDIIEAEYFFDTDVLGLGNNLPISIPTEANPTVTTSISTATLDPGIHIFYARVKNSDNKWSLYDRQLIYISELGSDTNIVAFEYYIDSETNGVTNLLVNPSEPSPSRDFSFNTTGLAEGDHWFCVRAKDENNNWSLYECEIFNIDPNLGIEDSLYKTVSISPNSFTNTINLEVSKAVVFNEIAVYDITGREVYTTTEDLRTLDLEYLESGTYILSLLTENEKATFKIVKQ